MNNEQDKAVQVRKPTVDQVEDEVGMSSAAWDCIDPQDIIDAVIKLSAPVTPAAEQLSFAQGIEPTLFDGYSVYNALSEKAKARTSAHNVADVLDAAVRVIRAERAATPPAQDAREAPPLPSATYSTNTFGSVYTAEQMREYARAAIALSKQDSGDADMFWDADDPEQCAESVHEVIDREYGNGSVNIGDTMTIQRAAKLPNIQVRIVAAEDDADDWDYEVIDAARQQSGEKK